MGCVMEGYKIRVNNEVESKEAQELFFELGAVWGQSKKASFNSEPMSYIYFNGSTLYYGHDDENDMAWFTSGESGKELTLPQLRDLVVLKRNCMDDQNHVRHGCVAYRDSDGYVYTYDKQLECWLKTDDKPLSQDTALISGADALRALADGVKPEEIEGRFSSGIETYFLSMDGKVDVFLKYLDKKLFRIKPQTVKLELELPKPFEPEEDCHVYILDDGKTDGYRRYSYEVHGDKGNTFIGIWRTEEEIKQVVEQLRKIKGAV